MDWGRNTRAYESAQRSYDAMEPPDDESCEWLDHDWELLGGAEGGVLTFECTRCGAMKKE